MSASRSATRLERQRAKAQHRREHPRWTWWVPFFVAFVVIFFQPLIVRAIGAVIAVGVVVLVERRPTFAMKWLLILVPFQTLMFAAVFRVGVPAEIVKGLLQWKEVLVFALIFVGVRKAVRERHKLDRLDAFVLAYVALGTFYFLWPSFIIGGEPGASLDFTTRLLGWRGDVMYVALFFGCRHLRLPGEAVHRLVRTFLITATVIGAIGFFEFIAPSSWNNFVINTLHLPQYKFDILNIFPWQDRHFTDIRTYTFVAGQSVLRTGSVFLDYEALGFYLPLAIALLADRIVRGTAERWHYVSLVVCGGAILLTETRSAVLAFVIVLVLSVFRRSSARRATDARVRFTLLLAGIAVVAIPAAFALGLVNRFNGEDDVSSNANHQGSFNLSYGLLVDHPLGRGLSTAAGPGQRGTSDATVVTETQYLQIGTQLGVVGLVLWLGVLVETILRSGRVAKRAPPDHDVGALTAARTALLAFVVAGAFLQVFIEFGVTWSVWGIAGLALGSAEAAVVARDQEPTPSPVPAPA